MKEYMVFEKDRNGKELACFFSFAAIKVDFPN